MAASSSYHHILKRYVDDKGDITSVQEHFFNDHRNFGKDNQSQRSQKVTHKKCIQTSVPVSLIKDHQAIAARVYSGYQDGRSPIKSNFSIGNFIKSNPCWSKKKMENLEEVFTTAKLDLRSHMDGHHDLLDPRVQQAHWFERVIMLRGEETQRFEDTFTDREPHRTFQHAGFSAKTNVLLNQLSSIRFVTQKLSQEQQRKRRNRGEIHSVSPHRSLYPHL